MLENVGVVLVLQQVLVGADLGDATTGTRLLGIGTGGNAIGDRRITLPFRPHLHQQALAVGHPAVATAGHGVQAIGHLACTARGHVDQPQLIAAAARIHLVESDVALVRRPAGTGDGQRFR